MALDPSKLDFQWRNYAVGPDNLKDTYSLRFDYEGKPYTFIPESVITKGINDGKQAVILPYFLDEKNLSNFFSTAQPVDLNNISWYGDWLKDKVGSSTSGYLVPGDLDVGNWRSYDLKNVGEITGLAKKGDQYVYATKPKGWDYGYVDANKYHTFKQNKGSSLLGKIFGSVGNAFSDVFNSGLDLVNSLGPVGNIAISAANPVIGAAIAGANTGRAAAQGNLSVEDIAKQAAATYAGSEIGAQVGAETGSNVLGNAAGTTSAGLLSGQDVGTALTSGAVSGTSTGIANSINSANSSTAGKDYTAGANYSAPSTGGGLGIKADMGDGTTLFGNTTGGDGLNINTALNGAANLDSMNGGQGLTIPSSTGSGTLGASGTENAWGVDSGTSKSPLDANAEIASGNTGTTVSPKTISTFLTSLFGGSNNMASSSSNVDYGKIIQGLLSYGGGLMSNASNNAALKTYATGITNAGKSAAESSAFKPVGMTTSYGTSNFNYDPVTGKLVSAGYSLSPEMAAAQKGVMGGMRDNLTDATNISNLGRSYIATSPEAAAADWYQKQQDILAPGRENAWARLNQGNYNQGTTGLKVAQGGNLQAANPYASALANAQANQDLMLAGAAQEQGRNAVTFGKGLLTGAYDPFNAAFKTSTDIEKAGQQPFTMSTNLGKDIASAGATSGRFGVEAATKAGELMKPVNAYNPYANLMSDVGSSSGTSTAINSLFKDNGLMKSIADYFKSNNIDTSQIDWKSIMPEGTFNGLTKEDIISQVGDEQLARDLGLID